MTADHELAKGDRWLTTAEAMAAMGIGNGVHFLSVRRKLGGLLPAHPVPGDRRKLRYKLSDVRRCKKVRRGLAKK